MKIEGPKKKIMEVIGQADKIASKNAPIPVLKCAYFDAKNKVLTVKATNLDLGLEIHIPVTIKEEGSVAIPASILNSFISNLSDDSIITLESENENLRVSTISTSTLIKTFPIDDFPTIPTVEDGDIFTINPKNFIEGLKAVWYGAALSSMKPELSSVYIYTKEDEIVFVATDSFRLAEKRIKAKISRDFGHILIPVRNIQEMIRILESAEGEVEVSVSKNQLSVSYENIYLFSRVIDGVFPDYKQLIPEGFKTEVTLLKQDLINSLKLASIFSDKFNQLNIKVAPKDGIFQLKMRNADIGESINKIECVAHGEDIEINVAQKYLLDCFQSIGSESISIQFNGLGRPIVIRGVSDKTFTYLMMPMNK